ncbi:MAG: glycosyltransferase family 4 protein [Candidatus Eisenbacteria bacterium]
MKLLLIVDRFDRSALCEAAWWMSDVATHAVHQGWQVEAACRDALDVAPLGVTAHPHGSAGFESALGDGLSSRPDLVYLATSGPLSTRSVEALGQTRLIVDVLTHWPLCPNDDLMWRPSYHRCDLRYPADECGPCAGFERLRDMESRLRLVARATTIVTHARFQAERLSALLGHAVECVSPGVDSEWFRSNPAVPSSEPALALWESRGQRPRVVLLGPPTHARGTGVLLDVVVGVRARVPDVEFVIAGDDQANSGWDRAFMTELRELGLAAQVRILSRVDACDWPAVIAASDVGIAPSLWDDPCGVFVLQAFACAVPVVASARGAHAELLQHGSGMLASPQSPALFADRVAMLLTHHDARQAMGEAARLHAVEHHDLSVSLDAIGSLMMRCSGELRRAG